MISHSQICFILAVFSCAMGDSDLSELTAVSNYNTYYPDYSYAYNYSAVNNPPGSKRIFTDEFDYTLDALMSITLQIVIPVPDLNTNVIIYVPLRYSFPTSSRRSEAGSGSGTGFGSGRSFSSVIESPRASMYKSIEGYIAQVTRMDGHACLLRAMCEASAYPLHDEGLVGDAFNFFLTANSAAKETDQELKHYVAAQAKGQLSGDCSTYNNKCRKSFFQFIDEIHFK